MTLDSQESSCNLMLQKTGDRCWPDGSLGSTNLVACNYCMWIYNQISTVKIHSFWFRHPSGFRHHQSSRIAKGVSQYLPFLFCIPIHPPPPPFSPLQYSCSKSDPRILTPAACTVSRTTWRAMTSSYFPYFVEQKVEKVRWKWFHKI